MVKGWMPLHYASAKGNILMAKYLVSHGADVSVASGDGKTPLKLAKDNPIVAAWLIEQGVTADTQDVENLWIALLQKGLAHASEREFVQAEEHYRRALATGERIRKPDHPDLFFTLVHLARMHRFQREDKQAEPLFPALHCQSVKRKKGSTALRLIPSAKSWPSCTLIWGNISWPSRYTAIC